MSYLHFIVDDINLAFPQAVIESGTIGPLVNLLQNAEFDIKKEAAWAISNATSGGSHDQIKYDVAYGILICCFRLWLCILYICIFCSQIPCESSMY